MIFTRCDYVPDRTSSLAIVEMVAGSVVDGGDFTAGAYINISFNQDTNKVWPKKSISVMFHVTQPVRTKCMRWGGH
jgi:hypothetical protein